MDTIDTSEVINHHRRRFFGTAAMTIAAAQLGMMGSVDASLVEPGGREDEGPSIAHECEPSGRRPPGSTSVCLASSAEPRGR